MSTTRLDAVTGGPALTDDEATALRHEAISYAAQHGLLVATESSESGATMPSTFTHAPIALLPTPFPADVFALATRVAPLFASVSDAVSRDDAFLRETLAGVIRADDFTRRVWDIYERCGGQEGRHPMELGVLRTDYMLDAPSGLLLQVEVNTVSTSFMALSTRVSQMHRRAIEWLGAERAYAEGAGSDAGSASAEDVASALARRLPTNSALELAAETLHAGWRAMNDDDARVLMVVQPCERNVFDQRMIEAALWERHGVKTIRATLREIASDAVVAEDDAKTLTYRGARVSVVYYRAGYAPTDYPSEAEWDARLLLERSGAVKSPSAAMHLAGTKKVQQTLASPGGLERFVECEEDVRAMRSVFAGLYALDGEDAVAAVELGLNAPESYVLKPQREGGGNNLYGEALRAQLAKFTPDAPIGSDGDLSSFILMQRILPPVNRTLCLRNGEMQELETLSELGIYGGYLRVGEDVAMNVVGGHLLRTKAASSDEGGVAAGYAVLDSPCLTFT